ncbi:MAG: glycine oxidase ThiO [Cyanobacteria bacterium P01_H01_bin.15]
MRAAEIIIIGGGVMGLAIATELAARGRSVQIISRHFEEAALHAAAGMLAPRAEKLPVGPLQDLCLRSRDMYGNWASKLTQLTGMDTGYWPCGILAPVFKEDAPALNDPAWLSQAEIKRYQAGLGPDVIGGWWYPGDGQVDNRQLAQTLLQAAKMSGVDIREGVKVEALTTHKARITELVTDMGPLQAETYVLAAGSWSASLLPLPVHPVKGQMLSLQMPVLPGDPLPIEQVLFGPGIYLVPRKDGRLVVGATVEQVGYQPHITPAGLNELLSKATRLFPAVQDWPLLDTWWGFRPGTPDELPHLGPTPFSNLHLAVGHYRNGILLAPITAQLLADGICEGRYDAFVENFNCERFHTVSSS